MGDTGGGGGPKSIAAKNEGSNQASTRDNSKKETGGSELTITRSEVSRTTSSLWGVHRVDIYWKYVVTDASGNPVRGLRLDEIITFTNKRFYYNVNTRTGGNTTDSQGSVPDHYAVPFGLPFVPFLGANGHVTVDQTITTPGGGEAKWKTTVNANGTYTTDVLSTTFR